VPIFAGTPHLKFFDAMEAEHCEKSGHDHQFETPNYKIVTCPETEWKLVVRREGKTPEEFKDMLSREFPSVGLGPAHHGRRIPDISELLELDDSKQANLIKCEVVAIVLYTGPLVSHRPVPLLASMPQPLEPPSVHRTSRSFDPIPLYTASLVASACSTDLRSLVNGCPFLCST
jgi:hypothetical protein